MREDREIRREGVRESTDKSGFKSLTCPYSNLVISSKGMIVCPGKSVNVNEDEWAWVSHN
jgi:hypothetical protein